MMSAAALRYMLLCGAQNWVNFIPAAEDTEGLPQDN